jgi:hypothetical protein
MKKIIVSPDYGAGWYSWNSEYPECLTDYEIIEMIESNAPAADIKSKATEKWEHGYWSAVGLEVASIEEGVPFHIHEYDGSESIMLQSDYNWIIL